MKKARVFLVTILTFILCLFCFAGCGVKGTYKFESMTVKTAGVEVATVKVGEEYEGEKLDADYLTIDLQKDGVAVFGGEEELTCSWEEKDGVVTFTYEGEKLYEATIEDGVMTIDATMLGTGAVIVLKK